MLEIIHVSKTYKGKTEVKALKDINLKMDHGVYALLGPNGAGKSTLMKILTLTIEKDAGEICWNSEDIRKSADKYRSILGYMPQQQALYESFTGRMFLNYISVLKNIDKNDIEDQVQRVAEHVNLQDRLEERIKGYSGGMKQRLILASAVLGNPQFIILDEPTAGLDPKERIRVRALAEKMGEEAIVLFATHVVSDIENIAKKIIIMNQGNIIADDTKENLIKSIPGANTLEDVYMHYFGKTENSEC